MKLLAIDGNSIVNRAYYGIKLLSTKDGMFTNAIYGFLNILEKIKAETKPDAIVVAFDLRAPTFRHKMYSEYKAGRKGMPEELAMQLPVLKELLEYMGYSLLSLEGFEADDILGTLARICEDKNADCLIATGDKDSLQLVSDKTNVRLATTKFGQAMVTLYDIDKVNEVYGVSPKQLIDIKAIQGDKSDNIPGVMGIGEKGAGELIQKFKSLNYIYENLENLDIKETVRAKLQNCKDNAILSFELGKIITDVPIDENLENFKIREPQMDKLSALMTKLELFKLMDKMNIGLSVASEENNLQEKDITVREIVHISSVLPMLEDREKAYFIKDNEYLYFENEGEILKVLADDNFLKSFINNEKIEKYCTDIKEFQKSVAHIGTVKNVKMDTGIAAYLLNPSASSYETQRLCAEFSVSVGKSEDEIANMCSALPELCEKLIFKIEENGQEYLLNEVEIPLAFVLADMEITGFKIDKNGIKEFGEELKKQIAELEKSIIEQVGYEFNINSPKQLGVALFEKLGLPSGKKTKTGYSTNAEVLESLRYQHTVVEDILNYRTLTKLNSTYCDGLLKLVTDTDRIHSSFNQKETKTGRISSTEPNLQNIPVRTELGANLRKYFIAKENCVLVDADYSQIELRVLAHVSKDPVMIEAFGEGKDIHTATASKVFNVEESFVTKEMRSSAKAVNFGIVYGIGAFSLSKDIGVSRKEADNYIKEYLRNFSGVDDYMNEIIAKAKEQGYVTDIFGRRRYLPEITSSNFNMRAFGERVARNMPIQGAAADIIKIAMVKVFERLKNENLEAKLILQVHDELIVECPKDEKEKVIVILQEEMQNSAKMSVPMIAEAKFGKTWYESK